MFGVSVDALDDSAASGEAAERVPVLLPDGLAEMPPGPGLAAMLESIDTAECSSADVFTALRAQARQVAHDQARLLVMMLEAAYAERADAVRVVRRGGVPDGPLDAAGLARVRELDDFCADQIAFTLHRSQFSTAEDVFLAKDLCERLPLVFERLSAGRIDLPRAKVFSSCLTDVDDGMARRLAAELIDKAERWDPALLRERLSYRVRRDDPDRARRRQAAAVTDRRVYVQPHTDGTAELAGTNLPPDRALAAYNRIDRIARAAKSVGDTRTLGQLRADTMLDLLSGRPFHTIPSLDDFTAEADQAARNLGLTPNHPDHPNDPPTPRHRKGRLQPRTRKPPGNPRGRGVITPTPTRPRPTHHKHHNDDNHDNHDDHDNGPSRATQIRPTNHSNSNPVPQSNASPDPNAGPNTDNRWHHHTGPNTNTGSDSDSDGVRPNPDGEELSDHDHLGRYLPADHDPIGTATLHPHNDPDADPDTDDDHDWAPDADRNADADWDLDADRDTGAGADWDHNPDRDAATPPTGQQPSEAIRTEPTPAQPQRVQPERAQPERADGHRPEPPPGTNNEQRPPTRPPTPAEPSSPFIGHGDPDTIPVASDDPRMCVCGGIQPAPRRGVVDIQVQLSTLMALNDNPGFVPGWGPILADIARQVAHDRDTNPQWKYSITDENGLLLHHGHIKRRPTTTEENFVKARDKTCRAPGCRHPATTCDTDHRQTWADHGPSHRANLESACRHHHRLRHEHGYHITHLPDGTFLWQAPNGHTYRVPPDATLHLTTEDNETALTEALIQYLIHHPHTHHENNTAQPDHGQPLW